MELAKLFAVALGLFEIGPSRAQFIVYLLQVISCKLAFGGIACNVQFGNYNRSATFFKGRNQLSGAGESRRILVAIVLFIALAFKRISLASSFVDRCGQI